MSDTPAQPGLNGPSKSFEPAALEAHWGPEWSAGYGRAGQAARARPTPARPGLAIQLPPPNVTGTLHMGHAFNQTIMDSLTRYHRMKGAATRRGFRHRPRGHRHANRGGAPAAGTSVSRHDHTALPKKVWEWKEQSGKHIARRCAAWATRWMEPRVLHHGRQAVQVGDRDLRQAL